MEPLDSTCLNGTQLYIKQEPESKFLDDCGIIDEPVSEEELIERPRKKKRIIINMPGHNNALINGRRESRRRNGDSELTLLPCIINIKSSAFLERPSQNNNNNGTTDTSNEQPNTSTSNELPNLSLESSIPEDSLCEFDDHVAPNEVARQNSSNNNFTSTVYEILENIQSTLIDLKAQVTENSKKIDELHKLVPQPCSWKGTKSHFNFPIATEEQLFEFEKQLENNDMARKLVLHLTSRTYGTWREMIIFNMKYMISRNVAVLYNLNGVKGSKKKFRDLNICNILVECVQYKFKEATAQEILKRISLTLAGSGSRNKKD